MQDLLIPGWAIYVFGTAGGGLLYWMVWLTLRQFKTEKLMALTSADHLHLKEGLEDISKSINETQTKIDDRFNRMDHKIDLFVSQEMSILKQLVQQR